MNEIILNLDQNNDRPIIQIMHLDALIDTGAEISVCNLSAEIFEILFEYKSKSPDVIRGYGGLCHGQKYIIRELNISSLSFKDVPMFVPDEPMDDKYKFIIASPLFKQTYFAFDMIERKMIIRYK